MKRKKKIGRDGDRRLRPADPASDAKLDQQMQPHLDRLRRCSSDALLASLEGFSVAFRLAARDNIADQLHRDYLLQQHFVRVLFAFPEDVLEALADWTAITPLPDQLSLELQDPPRSRAIHVCMAAKRLPWFELPREICTALHLPPQATLLSAARRFYTQARWS